MKVFVSYSHAQGDWVWDRLVPCLKAGSGVPRQMDVTHTKAGKQIFVP